MKIIEYNSCFILILLSGLFLGCSGSNPAIAAFEHYQNNEPELARIEIDAVIENRDIRDNGDNWYYRGKIYHSLYRKEPQLSQDAEKMLFETWLSYDWANEYGVSKRFIEDYEKEVRLVSTSLLLNGLKHYNEKYFERALEQFDRAESMAKIAGTQDSLILFNQALTLENLERYSEAFDKYKQILNLGNYGVRPYQQMSSLHYFEDIDTEQSLDILNEGLQKFPGDQTLLTTRVNIYLLNNESDLALADLNKLIEIETENTVFIFSRGNIYQSKYDRSESEEYYQKAESDYLKAIKLKQDYFDALYSLASLYFNKGMELNIDASTTSDDSEFERLKSQVSYLFNKAKPYAEKAYQLAPEDETFRDKLRAGEILNGLYINLNDLENYRKINRELEELKKKGGY